MTRGKITLSEFRRRIAWIVVVVLIAARVGYAAVRLLAAYGYISTPVSDPAAGAFGRTFAIYIVPIMVGVLVARRRVLRDK